MEHDFRTTIILEGTGPAKHWAQECIHCKLRVDLWENGSRSRWAEICLEDYPDCDTLHVTLVMET